MPLSLMSAGPVPAENEYHNLGNHERSIGTNSHDAQVWFNRGLTWAYSFNHGESAACFNQVIKHDPSCAMGYWGAAFASGPNYNKRWLAFDQKDLVATVKKCYDLSQKAKEVAVNASPVEQALIDAIQHRFPSEEPLEDFTPSIMAYTDAMREVYRRFSDDMDVVSLTADALMNTAPWKLYKAQTGEPDPSTPVLEIKEIMETALQRDNARRHPGILHVYIHLMEMSESPQQAILAADLLRDLVPDGGHMLHMPSHIDVLVGDY